LYTQTSPKSKSTLALTVVDSCSSIMYFFNSLRILLENAYSRPENVFAGFDPLNFKVYHRDPRRHQRLWKHVI